MFNVVPVWYIKKKVAVWKCSIVAVAVCTIGVVVGLYYPVALTGSYKVFGGTISMARRMRYSPAGT